MAQDLGFSEINQYYWPILWLFQRCNELTGPTNYEFTGPTNYHVTFVCIGGYIYYTNDNTQEHGSLKLYMCLLTGIIEQMNEEMKEGRKEQRKKWPKERTKNKEEIQMRVTIVTTNTSDNFIVTINLLLWMRIWLRLLRLNSHQS